MPSLGQASPKVHGLRYHPRMIDRAQLNALRAAGDLARAAELLEAGEAFDEARALYEKIWDFSAAARVAQRAGDLPGALTNILRSRDPKALDTFIAELLTLPHSDEVKLKRCAEICEERNTPALAAQIWQRLGDKRRAADLFEAAGMKLEAARLREAAGQHRQALALYQATLDEADEAEGGATVALTEYHLGRLLLRYGQTSDAVPLLQAAGRHDRALAIQASCAAAAALHRAGFAHAAKVSLAILGKERDDLPSLETCLADPSLAPLERDDADHTVLAGRYRLGKLLGSGGMGRVYDAHDLLDDARVAVKIFTAPGGARGRDAYKRFVREALTTGRLVHPHIVALRDFNEEMGFIVLEFMAGGTLEDRLRPRLGVAPSRHILLQIIEGLAAAHQRGIVHRDIKPSNIFFTAIGAAKLGDFGVAHLSDSGETQTGAFIGTLAYMSPEQIRGDTITFATDIYAIGVMLHLMLTGHLPFEPPDVIDKHLNAPPPRPSARVDELPSVCDEVVLRCLAKRPEGRYEDLAALRTDLLRFPGKDEGSLPLLSPSPMHNTPAKSQESAKRFTIEALRFVDSALELHEARDNELGRSILIARILPSTLRQELLTLLEIAAKVPRHMSHVLSIDLSKGEAILEIPLDTPITLPSTDPLGLAKALSLALSPLHARDLAHGALRRGSIAELEGYREVSLIEALIDRVQRERAKSPPPTLDDDLHAIATLTGLALPPTARRANELLLWIQEERRGH